MELSPVQRIAAFAVIVVLLAGLGIWLFLPSSSAASGSPRTTPSATPHHASPPASPGPSQSPGSPGAGTANIYQWLPFTQAGLASAAQLTTQFATDYGSYSYRQSTSAYLAPMQPLAQSSLLGVIGRAFASPGLVAKRTSQKQSATATSVIESLRAFGPTSLTFVVQVTQRITGTKGAETKVTGYAVTVTGTGTSWQVSDIELQGAGNT
jgi:hypothetical protein